MAGTGPAKRQEKPSPGGSGASTLRRGEGQGQEPGQATTISGPDRTGAHIEAEAGRQVEGGVALGGESMIGPDHEYATRRDASA